MSAEMPFPPQKYWRMSECAELLKSKRSLLLVKEFIHLTREVFDLNASVSFYENLLGFVRIPRPPFESEGVWLWGHELSLHLVQSEKLRDREAGNKLRILHYKSMPIADHFAFLSPHVQDVVDLCDEFGIYYYKDNSPTTGIFQVFIFDPDFNVVELSNCAPPVGQIKCDSESACAHTV